MILPSPYASSFGGFVDLPTSLWFAAWGLVPELLLALDRRRARARAGDGAAVGDTRFALPEDMSTGSLVGGRLIAGESLFALVLGLWGLARLL